MRRWRASRPAPIRDQSGCYTGETCVVCLKQRLVAALTFPVCNRCREKYEISEKLLKSLGEHRLFLKQETVDWKQKPYPVLSGTIDNVPWKADFVFEKEWSVRFLAAYPGSDEERMVAAGWIKEYLDKATPAWRERLKAGKTPIRRYLFFAAVGGTTILTAHYLLQRRDERLKRERAEAEEAEK